MDPALFRVNFASPLLLVTLLGCGESIGVRDAWIREPPPCSPAAGYLIIETRSALPVEFVGAETAAAELAVPDAFMLRRNLDSVVAMV